MRFKLPQILHDQGKPMPKDEATTIDGQEIYVGNLSAGPVVTGDLFSSIIASGNPELAGVVLTPLCDLAQEKVEWVKLAVAYPFQAYLEEVFIPQHFKGIEKYRELIEKDPKKFWQIICTRTRQTRQYKNTWACAGFKTNF